MSNYHVVYLTGAPATGKSTLTEFLASVIDPLHIFCYSKELLKHVNRHKNVDITSQDDIRRTSAKLITKDDVNAVDKQLIDFVQNERSRTHIIIDSHAVTKESYGYRVTPFQPNKLRLLDPTAIIVLYTESDTVIERITSNAQGRPRISPFEADFHTHLQASLALAYSLELGIPIHYLDSNKPIDILANNVKNILKLD